MKQYFRNFFEQYSKKVSDSFFKWIFTMICIPIGISFLIIAILSSIQLNNNINNANAIYKTSLKTLSEKNNNTLANISTIVNLVSTTNNFTGFINSTKQPTPETELEFRKIINRLKQDNPCIDSIYVYNKITEKVYTDTKNYSSELFFNDVYHYANYSHKFWSLYTSIKSDGRFLTPTEVNVDGVTKNIIPYVFTRTSTQYFCNIFVVNIDISMLLKNNNEYENLNNFNYLLDNRYNTIFSSTNISNETLSDLPISDIKGKSNSFYTSINNKNYFVITEPSISTIKGYTYFSLIPATLVSTKPYIAMLLSVFMLVILLAVVIAYYTSSRLYKPIDSLGKAFPNLTSKNKGSFNLLNSLNEAIQENISVNSALKTKYESLIPIAQEKQIIDLLNQNKNYEVNSNCDIPFKYDYFTVIVFKFIPTQLFYETYTKEHYIMIKSSLGNIIRDYFPKDYDCYIISSEIDTIYAILNTKSDENLSHINSVSNALRTLLDYDKDYINIVTNIGGTYSNISGLIKSHQEAISAASLVYGLNLLDSSVDDPKNTAVLSSTFTIADENHISNLIITNQILKAKKLIYKTYTQLENSSEYEINEFLSKIFMMMFKIMEAKNIVYDFEKKGSLNITKTLLTRPKQEIISAIDTYLNMLDKKSSHSEKLDLDEIVTYIKENMTKDISLNTISDRFGTSPKYLSKFIKDKLGIKYTEFLADLRIKRAQELLCDSTLSITDIFPMVGFTNRVSFTRVFKEKTGFTPTEYRKYQNNN